MNTSIVRVVKPAAKPQKSSLKAAETNPWGSGWREQAAYWISERAQLLHTEGRFRESLTLFKGLARGSGQVAGMGSSAPTSSGSTPDISGIGGSAGGYQGAAQAANQMVEQSSFQDSMIQLSHSMDDKAIGVFPTQAQRACFFGAATYGSTAEQYLTVAKQMNAQSEAFQAVTNVMKSKHSSTLKPARGHRRRAFPFTIHSHCCGVIREVSRERVQAVVDHV